METAIDYLTMSAGAALDRHVAELQGWRVVEVTKRRAAILKVESGWYLQDQNGTLIDGAYSGEGIVTWHRTPAFSTDADAALTLLNGFYWSMRGTPDHYTGIPIYRVSLDGHVSEPCWDIEAVAETPALAICRAWLAWREASATERADR